jgi:polar amino acid transport system substrate-binding protein
MRRVTLAFGTVVVATALLASALLGTAQSATPKFGQCKPTGKFGSVPLKKVEEDGVLNVGYVQLGPLTYRGNTPSSVNAGHEYCLAANVAWRAGLDKIKLHKVDFAQLVVGRLKGFDIALDDIYIKPEREQKVDFSIPYDTSWSGLVGYADKPLTKADLKNLKIAVTLGSVQQKWIDTVLKPTQKEATFDDTTTMFAALKAKQVDAVLIDLPVALPAAAASNGEFKTYAQVKVGGIVGIVMPQGTPNRAAVNTMIKQMKANGTLKGLQTTFYLPAYGGVDPDKLPFWG